MPVDLERREKWLAWQAKKFDSNVYNGDNPLFEESARIPFLSPTLTWATGGGLKIGHWSRLYGPEGSGKSLSLLGLLYCAQHYPRIVTEQYEREIYFWESRNNKFKATILKKRMQRLVDKFPDGMSALVYDTEGRFEMGWANRIGVKTKGKNFFLSDETIIENIADQMAAGMEAFHIIIVDSASNAQSLAEAALEPGEELRASGPRAWSRLKKVRQTMDRGENTIIIVDQVRTQLGSQVWSGKGLTTEVSPPKIRFFKHNVSTAINFFEGKKLYLMDNGALTDDYKKASDDYKTLGAKGKEVAGLEMRCRMDKNSTGKPFLNAAMRFQFPVADVRTGELIQDVAFDQSFELALIAEHFHLIESSGSGNFYLLDDKFRKTSKKPWRRGEANVRQAIAEDEELQDRIRTRIAIDV